MRNSKETHPNQRVLGIPNGGEGAEVEDESELCLLWGQSDGGKGRVLNAGKGVVGGQDTLSWLQGGQKTGQGTRHLT